MKRKNKPRWADTLVTMISPFGHVYSDVGRAEARILEGNGWKIAVGSARVAD